MSASVSSSLLWSWSLERSQRGLCYGQCCCYHPQHQVYRFYCNAFICGELLHCHATKTVNNASTSHLTTLIQHWLTRCCCHLCNGPLCGHAPQWVISLQVFPFSQIHNTWCDLCVWVTAPEPESSKRKHALSGRRLRSLLWNKHTNWCVRPAALFSLHIDLETLG